MIDQDRGAGMQDVSEEDADAQMNASMDDSDDGYPEDGFDPNDGVVDEVEEPSEATRQAGLPPQGVGARLPGARVGGGVRPVASRPGGVVGLRERAGRPGVAPHRNMQAEGDNKPAYDHNRSAEGPYQSEAEELARMQIEDGEEAQAEKRKAIEESEAFMARGRRFNDERVAEENLREGAIAERNAERRQEAAQKAGVSPGGVREVPHGSERYAKPVEVARQGEPVGPQGAQPGVAPVEGAEQPESGAPQEQVEGVGAALGAEAEQGVFELPGELNDPVFVERFGRVRGEMYRRWKIAIPENDPMFFVLMYMVEVLVLDDERRSDELQKSLDRIFADGIDKFGSLKTSYVEEVKEVTKDDFKTVRTRLEAIFEGTVAEHKRLFEDHAKKLEVMKRSFKAPSVFRAWAMGAITVSLVLVLLMNIVIIWSL